MKVRDVIKRVEADGWYHVGTRGSHRQYKHPVKKGRTTIPGHPSDEMDPSVYNSVLEQAQIDKKQIRRKKP
ncbi:MAG TPA: type II toxin-antitoxin system HicA family toxin [Ktedonobacteraceae bacterium]|nr:type II toxin-antitoxin system HicA family toxin [Ktedonobacteraceae bacterium]